MKFKEKYYDMERREMICVYDLDKSEVMKIRMGAWELCGACSARLFSKNQIRVRSRSDLDRTNSYYHHCMLCGGTGVVRRSHAKV